MLLLLLLLLLQRQLINLQQWTQAMMVHSLLAYLLMLLVLRGASTSGHSLAAVNTAGVSLRNL